MFPWNYFPFKKDSQNGFNPNNIEQYVNDIVGKVFPEHLQDMLNQEDDTDHRNPKTSKKPNNKPGKLDYSVFDTHEFVFVRIKIEDKDWVNRMKVFYTSNQIIIEHIPKTGNKHTITLPALVRRKGATAYYRDDMLEVKIPKREDLQYSEIDITEK